MVSSNAAVTDLKNTDAFMPTVKVLLLDDSEFDRLRIRKMMLDAGVNLKMEEAATLEGFSSHLDAAVFDVVLIDYNLTAGNGMDALRIIQKHPENADAMTVMITGDDHSEIAVQAIKMGCEDYISKSALSSERLKQAVIGSLTAKLVAGEATQEHHRHIEMLAADVLNDLSSALQPKLAKMLRDIRLLKRRLDHPDTNVPQSLSEIDRTCVELWKALSEAPELCSPRSREGLH